MHKFEKLKIALISQGWYVGWAVGYTQSEAWCELPYDVDLDKCLFNIIQDVESYEWIEEQEALLREIMGITEEDEETDEFLDALEDIYERAEEEVLQPYQVDGSHFCFGDVNNLKQILHIIKSTGCKVDWDGTINTRPYISW